MGLVATLETVPSRPIAPIVAVSTTHRSITMHWPTTRSNPPPAKVCLRQALSIPAVYQAVSMISGDVAKLPMGVWRRQADGGRSLLRTHHAFRYVNLVGMANAQINAFKFWRRLLISALLWEQRVCVDRQKRQG